MNQSGAVGSKPHGVQDRGSGSLVEAAVVSRESLCREHFRLTLALPVPDVARPGQFLYLGHPADHAEQQSRPFLRRAYSIADLRPQGPQCEVDIIYRIHGPGTHWLATLRAGDRVSILGPLGNGFELVPSKPNAWLVAGGVGLPALLWLAQQLRAADKATVAFCGARHGDLMPLKISDPDRLPRDATTAVPAAEEFARSDTPVVLATDDGSVGFHGTVCQALDVYRRAWGGDDKDVVLYCCGPEAMMAAAANWSSAYGIECYVCMERAMACGVGTCQSCVVRVRDAADAEGWRYALCCAEGPVFDAREVLWD